MLPKEEKIKKTPDEKQPGLFDKEDEKKRLTKKRRFIYLALILTTGLSLSFWAYRSIKNKNFSFKMPSINLPNFQAKNLSINPTASISLPKDTNSTWSFFLKNLDSNSIVFQNNQDLIFSSQDLDSILIKLDQTKETTSNLYISTLPEGLKIKEIITEDAKNFSYISEIITPSQKILLIIKIANSSDLSQAKGQISGLVDQMYWYSIQK